ncbi:MAG TPA: hypothetical protein VN681_12095 [Stellaceae bacterium]|nr:hypothetical protein [Stellaceae bacterium]
MFRRSAPLGAALAVLLSLALLSLLFLPAKDEANLRLVLDWRPTVEPLLLIAGLAALALTGRALRPAARWLLALLLFAAALIEAADAAMLGIFDRELNLYLDLPHVPSLLGLFWDAAGAWRGMAGIAAAALGAVAAVAVIAALLGVAQRALAPRRHAVACLAVVAAGLAAGALPVFAGASLLRARPSIALGEQAARIYRSWAVMSGHDRRYAGALAAPQPPPGPLPGLKRRDVYLVFFESYGTSVLDTPRYAATVKPALEAFAATVGRAGYHLASSRIVSPTFGGGSWLAHGTVDAGVKLDALLARLIATTSRETLPRYMSAAGYRAIAVMPGIKTPAPDHAFWGFERSDYAADLGYDGPPFGWFGIPDQYTLAHLDATEGAPGHAPLFAQIVLVSSHTPFAPVPPYVAAGDQAGLYQGYRGIAQSAWDRIYAPPDWAHLDEPYIASVVYDLEALGNWLAHRPGDALVIILGDHQPPGFIAGDKQPWTVPIHVMSRDADLLRPFLAAGYAEGAIPPAAGRFKGMETFLGDFLAAYSRPPANVAGRRGAPEHVSD